MSWFDGRIQDAGNKRLNDVTQEVGATKRVLVLGSTAHSRQITAYTWDKLPSSLNVANYDVIILNLVPFAEGQHDEGIDLETLPSQESFWHLLLSEDAEIIMIGSPEVGIPSILTPPRGVPPATPSPRSSSATPAADEPMRRVPGYRPPVQPPASSPPPRLSRNVMWWFPLTLNFASVSGERIGTIDPSFQYYFQYVKSWSFYVVGGIVFKQKGVEDLEPKIQPIAQTRFGAPIAFELSLFNEKSKEVLPGKVIWLPATTDLPSTDAVNLILRERYGIGTEQTAPIWTQVYELPREQPIKEEVHRLEAETQRLKDMLQGAQQQLQQEGRFRKLLYETGEDVLEPVVREALRELEAIVVEPQKRGREDGRLTDPSGRQGMLEIKGVKGQAKLDHVRQLRQWVEDAECEEVWEGKGILIANVFIESPPQQRRVSFSENSVPLAKRANLCLITTTQLFRALVDHQRGELDVMAFWDTIFNTSGVCPLPDLDT